MKKGYQIIRRKITAIKTSLEIKNNMIFIGENRILHESGIKLQLIFSIIAFIGDFTII